VKVIKTCLFTLVLILLFSLCHAMTQDTIAASHIMINTPDQSLFNSFLERDLKAYFLKEMEGTFSLEYEFLRKGPTQSGVAYPKFYLWVKVIKKESLILEGAVRVAAVERTHFEVTNFVSRNDIDSGKTDIYKIFPVPVCEVISNHMKK